MISLLYKEYLTHRTLLFVYCAVIALSAVLLGEMLPVATVLACMIPFPAVSVEDKNNSHLFINSLPVNRKAVVRAKYLFTLLVGLSMIGMVKLVQWALFPSGTGFWDGLVAAVAVGGFVAVFYPLYYWLGPRFVQIGLVIFILLLIGVVPPVFNWGAKNNYWGLLHVIQSSPLYSAVILLGCTGLFLILSLLLSARIYGRKDF